MKRPGTTNDPSWQPLCGRLCQLGALVMAAVIAVAWWRAPVNANFDDVELLSAIAILSFCVVLAGMVADRLTTSAARPESNRGYVSAQRLAPAVALRSPRQLRNQS